MHGEVLESEIGTKKIDGLTGAKVQVYKNKVFKSVTLQGRSESSLIRRLGICLDYVIAGEL